MKKILSSNSLKLIAIFTMLIDHIGVLFIDSLSIYIPFRFIGRICAPIMFYSLAKGYFHTKNKLKYGIRLFIFALISQIPYSLFIRGCFFDFLNYNVIFTLFLGFISLLIFDKVEYKLIKYSLMVLCVLLSMFCDYAIVGIVFVLLFYLCKESKYKYLLYTFVCVFYIGVYFFIYRNFFDLIIRLGLFLVLPLIYMDNGEKGKYNLKYLFYVFYPLHMLILFFFI